ncbi:hypothetical protein KDL01_10145 [Actinospica durhamensis]|uniref:Uncharacterized protein n=1 Tax=Actinospica durhamensis TaxID=1508375 RepID=A0A941ELP4_9ACTN|nr:hypothetical protein [Actinospica durhamensis]MBR7833626.1 hypothetical protein [Actinospica durhamensis]
MNIAFFVASSEEEAAWRRGPGPGVESVAFWNADFHPDSAVLTWESWLAGVTTRELKDLGQPQVVELPANDGYAVYVLSVRLLDALAVEEPSGLRELATVWVDEEIRSEGSYAISSEAAVAVLERVSALCRSAASARRDRVYYWRG